MKKLTLFMSAQFCVRSSKKGSDVYQAYLSQQGQQKQTHFDFFQFWKGKMPKTRIAVDQWRRNKAGCANV